MEISGERNVIRRCGNGRDGDFGNHLEFSRIFFSEIMTGPEIDDVTT